MRSGLILRSSGFVAPVGRNGVEQFLGVVAAIRTSGLPAEVARACLAALGAQLRALKVQILEFDRMITGLAPIRGGEQAARIRFLVSASVLATALVASVADPKAFRSGRDFSAWIGLVPKQNSSGGKERLGNISKRAIAICAASVHGAHSVIATQRSTAASSLAYVLARRPTKVVAIALANKLARMAWAMMAKGGAYRAPALAATA